MPAAEQKAGQGQPFDEMLALEPLFELGLAAGAAVVEDRQDALLHYFFRYLSSAWLSTLRITFGSASSGKLARWTQRAPLSDGVGAHARTEYRKFQRKMQVNTWLHAAGQAVAISSSLPNRGATRSAAPHRNHAPRRCPAPRSSRRAGLFRAGCAPARSRRRAAPRRPRRAGAALHVLAPCAETFPARRAQRRGTPHSTDRARRPAVWGSRSWRRDPSAPARNRRPAPRQQGRRQSRFYRGLAAGRSLRPRTAAYSTRSTLPSTGTAGERRRRSRQLPPRCNRRRRAVGAILGRARKNSAVALDHFFRAQACKLRARA